MPLSEMKNKLNNLEDEIDPTDVAGATNLLSMAAVLLQQVETSDSNITNPEVFSKSCVKPNPEMSMKVNSEMIFS